MKARDLLWLSCLIGAFAAYGCSDDATSGGGYSVCGNGIIENDESCDDGNQESGDGCDSMCRIESGWVCIIEGEPCVPEDKQGVCGDGKVDTGEVCDDGNTVDGDGCRSDCKKVESSWTCPPQGGTCTKESAVCGNGIVEDGELCDDGNTANGDGCSSDCMGIESGWECPPTGGGCTQTSAHCGDGFVNRSGEECDPGEEGLLGCTEDCKIAIGWNCSNDDRGVSTCWEMVCGDGIFDTKNDEECDNGIDNVADGSYGLDEKGHPQCDQSCHYAAYCGDGERNGSEECDNGENGNNGVYQKAENDGCTSLCKKAGWCGDGVFQKGHEKCDPKDPKSKGGCSDECVPKDGYACDSEGACTDFATLPEPGCGIKDDDGNLRIDLELGEECDQEKGEGCDPVTCKAMDGYKCIASPKPCSTCTQKDGEQCEELKCGDGYVDPDGYEECDLGNSLNGKGNGCTTSCTIEPGYACKSVIDSDGKIKSICNSVCGDGVRTEDEECDAGKNNGDGKGCSAACRIEEYATCTSNALGHTSVCTPGKCGDGKIGKGEVCDDGNSRGGDGCSADCKAVEAYYKCRKEGGSCALTACGDGKLNDGNTSYIGEECDLGAGKNGEGKGCTYFCRLEPGYECANSNCTQVKAQSNCGDGILGKNEACDDRNQLGGDGCSPECRVETGFECFNNTNESASVCRPTCGDGIWNITSTKIPGKTPTNARDLIEECDLGSDNGKGKGCSIDCKLQDGYYLDIPKVDFPDTIELPVTFRDFKGSDVRTDNDKSTDKAHGRADSAWYNRLQNKYSSFGWNDCDREKDILGTGNAMYPKRRSAVGIGHPDFENFSGNLCTGILGTVGKSILGRDGKPVLTHEAYTSNCVEVVSNNQSKAVKTHLYCQASFDSWYRDDEQINKRVDGKLLLEKKTDEGKTIYVFDSANPPVGSKTLNGKSYSWINSEMKRIYPKSAGSYFAPLYSTGFNEGVGTTNNSAYLDSKMSDINGSFTTEIHTTIQYRGENATLEFDGDDDVWVFLNDRLFVDVGGMHAKVAKKGYVTTETCKNDQKCDKTYGLYNGGIYDLKIFHAERDRTGSNFKLTLTGFVPTAKSKPSDFKTVCGDGIVAVGTEDCDYGDPKANEALYKLMSCDPNKCTIITNDKDKTCGNGVIDLGETCDTGFLCNDPAYKPICDKYGRKYVENPNCDMCQTKGAVCGNGKVDEGEECDTKDPNTMKDCTPMCTKSRCGDGYVDKEKGEDCDMGDVENEKGIVCTTACHAPYCGDGIVSKYNGEVCDDGINDGAYGHCGVGCTKWGPRCGDGVIQEDREECDNGTANNDELYGGCTTQCTLGGRCGDGIVQKGYEECDAGDENGEPGVGCTLGCRKVVN